MQFSAMKPFCGSDTEKYELKRPFVQKGYWYATDGIIIVRVPAPGAPDTVSEAGKKYPRDCASYFKNFPECTHELPNIFKKDEWELDDTYSLDPAHLKRIRSLGLFPSPNVLYHHIADWPQVSDRIFFRSGELQGVCMLLEQCPLIP